MIHEKIQGVILAINGLAGKVGEEAWETLKCARAELADAAEMSRELENRITVEAAHG